MRRNERPVYASKKQMFIFAVVILAALVAIYRWQQHSRSKRAQWPSAPVSLSEFRTIPVQVVESERGSNVAYQGQAYIRYVVGAKRYAAWLPVLSRSSNRQTLQSELNALKDSSCYIHWDQAQPDSAFLSCDNRP